MHKGKWDILEIEYQNGVLRITPTDDMNYELDDIQSFHRYVLEITKDEPFLVLSDYRFHHLILTSDTIRFAAKDEWLNKNKIAEAVLIKSLPNLLVARFFIQVLKPLTPTKIFKNEENARKWLESKRLAVEA